MSASVNIGALMATLGVDISEFQAKLNTAKEELDKLSKETEKAQHSIDKMGESFSKVGKKMESTGKKMSLAITAPLLVMGTAMGKVEMEFEAQMTKITSLIGVSETQVKAWRGEVLKMSQATGIGPQKLAEALYFVSSAGFRGAEALDILESSAKASAAGMGETTMIADNVTSALNAFRGTGLDAAKATDILINAVRLGKVEAEDLVVSLGHVFPIAAELGIAYHEVGAAVAAMTRTGTPAETAAVQLRQALSQIINPSTQAKEALRELKWSAEEFRNELRNEGIFSALETFMDKIDQFGDIELAGDVFGNIRALTGVLDLMGSNVEENRMIFEEMANTMDRTNFAFATVSMTLKQKWNVAIAHSQTAMIKVGETIKGMIIPLIMDLTGWLEDLSDKWNNMTKEQQENIMKWLAIAAAVGPVLFIFGKTVSIIGTTVTAFKKLGEVILAVNVTSMVTAFKKLKKTILAVNVASWANPYVLLGAALVGVGVAIGYVLSQTVFLATAQEKAHKTVGKIKDELALQNIQLQSNFDRLTALTGATTLSNVQQNERKQLLDQINSQYAEYLPFLLTEKSSLEDIAKAQEAVTLSMANSFLEKKRQMALKGIDDDLLKEQERAYKKMKKILEKAGVDYAAQTEILATAMVGDIAKIIPLLNKHLGEYDTILNNAIDKMLARAYEMKKANEAAAEARNIIYKGLGELEDWLAHHKGLDTEDIDELERAYAAVNEELALLLKQSKKMSAGPLGGAYRKLGEELDRIVSDMHDAAAINAVIPQAWIDRAKELQKQIDGIDEKVKNLLATDEDEIDFFAKLQKDVKDAFANIDIDAEHYPSFGVDIDINEERMKALVGFLGKVLDGEYGTGTADMIAWLKTQTVELDSALTNTEKVLAGLEEQMEFNKQSAKLFGEVMDEDHLQADLNATKNAIFDLLKAKEVDMLAVNALMSTYDALSAKLKTTVKDMEGFVEISQILNNALAGILTDSISALFTPLEEGEKMTDRMLQIVGDYLTQMGKALIAAAAAVIAFEAVWANPYLAVIAGAAAVALGALFKATASGGPQGQKGIGKPMAAFADGGLVYGPTIGMVGEYVGAQNNPEVIAPLSDLKNLLDDNYGSGSNVEFVIKGDRLVGVINNYNKRVKSYK